MKYLFTSESVTEGHPDKMCDQISDALLDAILVQDPVARVACEVAITTDLVVIIGEISTTATVDIEAIVRNTIKEIGYCDNQFGFNGDTCRVLIELDSQSEDIALGVNQALEKKKGETAEDVIQGAGDQGMMIGYACDETKEMMPLAIALAHKLCMKLAEVRKKSQIPYLGPDGKAQVTVEYHDNVPARIDSIVVSSQHRDGVNQKRIYQDILDKVIRKVIPKGLLDDDTKIYVNPTGRFVIGGPVGDAGLTGRKIIVDTYGGYVAHGGGAFSGKDPSKVDRSGAYMLRYIAKNVVASGLASRCEIEIAYVIGVANPVSLHINTYGTSTIPEKVLIQKIEKTFELTPMGIINSLDLRTPIFRQTAAYGHFGRTDIDLPWERTDRVARLLM